MTSVRRDKEDEVIATIGRPIFTVVEDEYGPAKFSFRWVPADSQYHRAGKFVAHSLTNKEF